NPHPEPVCRLRGVPGQLAAEQVLLATRHGNQPRAVAGGGRAHGAVQRACRVDQIRQVLHVRDEVDGEGDGSERGKWLAKRAWWISLLLPPALNEKRVQIPVNASLSESDKAYMVL
ncbi:unnamed protein product, partial [Mycena citricolor]